MTLAGGTAPRIGTHVLIGFGAVGPTGSFPWNKTVWELPPTSSLPDVLLRGGRLDGQGSLYFEGGDAGPVATAPVRVVDPKGGQASFFGEMLLPARSGSPSSSGTTRLAERRTP
jgi:hypothetical protein